MSSWQTSPPPAGFYPDQQGFGQPPYPKQEGYPPQSGLTQPPYPKQEGYPPQSGFTQAGGYPPQPGYPPQQPGYPAQPGYPPQQGFPPQPGFTTYGPSPPPPYETLNPSSPPAAGFGSNQPGMYGSSYGDEPLTHSFDFSEKTIRHGFIRKVYSILMCQLLLSLSFISIFTYHQGTKEFVKRHPEMQWIALILVFVTLISMACCPNVRRKSPMNFIFLFIFTLCESFLLGVTASRFNTDSVMIAVGICAAVCLGLSLFALQTKWDFTVMGGVLFVAVIILLVFGIVAMIFPGKTMILVYASLGALIFCVYLVYDTQMMIGGKHKYSLSPEEYIFAALNLYLDIVNIFIYILTIVGIARD